MNINTIYPRRFATGDDLCGQTPTLPVRAVTMEQVGPAQKPVVWFEGARKGIVMGAVLARQIAAVLGPETDAWTGQTIQLYTVRIKVNGEFRIGIRARAPQEPQQGLRVARFDREADEMVYAEVPA